MIDLEVPKDIRGEEAVIGSLLLDRDAVITTAPMLNAPDFYVEKWGHVYGAILALYARREPPDLVTVCAELESRKQLDGVGGLTALVELVDSVPTAVHVGHYAKIVADHAVRRRMISAGGEVAGLAFDTTGDIEDTIAKATNIILKVSEQVGKQEYVTMHQLADEYYDLLEKLQEAPGEPTGVPTGFRDIDAATGGLQRGDLVIMAARTSVGKTSLMLNMAYNAANTLKPDGTPYRVGIYELEMPRQQLIQRMIAIETGVDSQKLRHGGLSEWEYGAVSRALGKLSSMSLMIDDRAPLKVSELRARAHRMKAEQGLDLLIVDYLQLLHGTARRDGNRVQEVGEISGGLKMLARELDVPVLVGAQLNRAIESRASHKPMLSDLRESGSIEQDADIVMFIHRAVLYDSYTPKPDIANVYVAKHRNGPLIDLDLRFDSATTKFSNT